MLRDSRTSRVADLLFLPYSSLDLMLENHSERIHALRLTRRMMYLAPDVFPESLVRTLTALVQDGPPLNDWMFKAALGVTCELGKNAKFLTSST